MTINFTEDELLAISMVFSTMGLIHRDTVSELLSKLPTEIRDAFIPALNKLTEALTEADLLKKTEGENVLLH